MDLDYAPVHASLTGPVGASMTFLNEVALRYPDAVSLAAGRPYEGFFDLDLVHSYLDTYRRHLSERFLGDEVQVRRTLLQYGRTKGIIHELIAGHLRVDEGIEADPEAVVVTVGCQEALFLTLRALRTDHRDAVLAVAPSYVGVHGAAALVDMPLLPVRDSALGIDLADLAATVARARAEGLRPRALYVIPDFANPSGARMDLATRLELLDLAAREGLLLLEDNPYGLFAEAGGPPTLRALAGPGGPVVYLGSFGKTGVPGARVGYALAEQRLDGRNLLADQLAKIKSILTVNTSPLAQAVIGGKLLEHGLSLRQANLPEAGVYRRNLALMLDALARNFAADGPVRWSVPAGGFFLLLHVPFPAGDEQMEQCARSHGVLWTPAHHFYAETAPRPAMRLAFSHLTPAEITHGTARLAAYVHEQWGQRLPVDSK